MSTELPTNRPHANRSLYAIIVVGIAILAGFAAWSLSAGGLPGTKNSPSAVVNGQTTVGKTGAD
jgi:hypothetical protein